ncbi:hypothetical protein ACWDE0_43955 [Streptomyces sp. 900105755]|uniref:hypothetical protein n=1 Tax=Streptomyces sp. Ag109_O5-10 TaxID=1855349 RepID=UPI000894A0E0|nr:hypothetical protein [Streptomyces sp. Ag109_O5-10]SED83831.1 hypothetical protein SAMN05216533_0693 [Streptomyces sp. Ag109_O5-10]
MTVGTSLTPEFWEHFSVLLVLALATTAILTAVFTTAFDALTARLRNRRRHSTASREPRRPSTPSGHRTSVHC